jgi:DHA2 family multidrug resistance protein
VAFAASYLMRSFYTPDSSFVVLAAPLLLQGLAMSCFFVPLLTITLDGIAPERLPSASGISNFARITAASFAASLITTFWDRRESLHQAQLVESTTQFSPAYHGALTQLQTQGFSPLQASGSIYRQLIGQSYLLSSIELFWLCGWMAFSMVVLVWFARRPAPSDHVVAAD